jgi:hypothetical protein
MYLALSLTPWMLIYALSTMAMNHQEFFNKVYGEKPVKFDMEKQRTYEGTFPAGATSKQAAVQILKALDWDGAFSVQGRLDGEGLTILRRDPITPRRITYTPKDRMLVIERQIFRMPAFLEQLHRRCGYGQGYVLEDTWAFSVDLVIVAMVFWGLSGLWMWWELRATRRWGALSLLTGMALFGFFLFII